MSYLVKCIGANGASVPKKVEVMSHEVNNWTYGMIDTVADEVIAPYVANSSVFTILGHNGVLTPGTASGVAVVTGLTASDVISGVQHQTTFTLADMAQAVVNGTEYQSTKLFQFPEGRIYVMGAIAHIAQKTTSALASTLNASSTGALSVGSVTSSNVALTSTMADIIPSTAFTSSATINVAGTAVNGVLASPAVFDGTTTPMNLFISTAYATTTDVDADATQTLTGYVTVTWTLIGDY